MWAAQGVWQLMDGNRRFVAGRSTALNHLAARRAQLVTDQTPFATIVCCSDSRVPPEIVFDQPLGQLFVVRTAGQVLDEAALSSVVFGVDALKTPLLLVLGHARCGAVSAAVKALRGGTVPAYAGRFVESIGPAVVSVLDQPGDLVDLAVRANVRLGVDRLKGAQPVLAEAVGSGRLTVVGAYYDLASGQISLIA